MHLILFDLMHLDGRSLLREPYARRREELLGLGLDGPFWSIPAALVGHGAEALRATAEHGLEGLVCKRLDSVYEPGSAPAPGSRSATCAARTCWSAAGCRERAG